MQKTQFGTLLMILYTVGETSTRWTFFDTAKVAAHEGLHAQVPEVGARRGGHEEAAHAPRRVRRTAQLRNLPTSSSAVVVFSVIHKCLAFFQTTLIS